MSRPPPHHPFSPLHFTESAAGGGATRDRTTAMHTPGGRGLGLGAKTGFGGLDTPDTGGKTASYGGGRGHAGGGIKMMSNTVHALDTPPTATRAPPRPRPRPIVVRGAPRNTTHNQNRQSDEPRVQLKMTQFLDTPTARGTQQRIATASRLVDPAAAAGRKNQHPVQMVHRQDPAVDVVPSREYHPSIDRRRALVVNPTRASSSSFSRTRPRPSNSRSISSSSSLSPAPSTAPSEDQRRTIPYEDDPDLSLLPITQYPEMVMRTHARLCGLDAAEGAMRIRWGGGGGGRDEDEEHDDDEEEQEDVRMTRNDQSPPRLLISEDEDEDNVDSFARDTNHLARIPSTVIKVSGVKRRRGFSSSSGDGGDQGDHPEYERDRPSTKRKKRIAIRDEDESTTDPIRALEEFDFEKDVMINVRRRRELSPVPEPRQSSSPPPPPEEEDHHVVPPRLLRRQDISESLTMPETANEDHLVVLHHRLPTTPSRKHPLLTPRKQRRHGSNTRPLRESISPAQPRSSIGDPLGHVVTPTKSRTITPLHQRMYDNMETLAAWSPVRPQWDDEETMAPIRGDAETSLAREFEVQREAGLGTDNRLGETVLDRPSLHLLDSLSEDGIDETLFHFTPSAEHVLPQVAQTVPSSQSPRPLMDADDAGRAPAFSAVDAAWKGLASTAQDEPVASNDPPNRKQDSRQQTALAQFGFFKQATGGRAAKAVAFGDEEEDDDDLEFEDDAAVSSSQTLPPLLANVPRNIRMTAIPQAPLDPRLMPAGIQELKRRQGDDGKHKHAITNTRNHTQRSGHRQDIVRSSQTPERLPDLLASSSLGSSTDDGTDAAATAGEYETSSSLLSEGQKQWWNEFVRETAS